MDQPLSSIPIEPENKETSYTWLIILTIIFLTLAVGVAIYQNFWLKKQLTQAQPSPSLIPLISPSPILPSQAPVSSPSPSPATVYLISLKLKSSAVLPPLATGPQAEFSNLADYLNSVLSLPQKTLTKLYYDTQVSKPYDSKEAPFQTSFYSHFNQPLVLQDSYEDQYLNLTVKTAEINLLPFLIKSDYCQQDSDCAIGADMCTYGAFNYYRKYYDPPWGCGPGGYKSNFSWFKWGERDDQLNCNVELKFAGAKCVDNQCTESSYEKVCTNTGNP